jgi:hypothetical protein
MPPHGTKKENIDDVAFHSEFQLPLHQNKLNAILKELSYSPCIYVKKNSANMSHHAFTKNILNNL